MIFRRKAPVYTSEALVQVIQKNIGEGMNFGALDRGLKDAAFEIASPDLIKGAYANHDLAELGMFQGLSEVNAQDVIAEMMSVTTGLDKTNIVKVAVSGSSASNMGRLQMHWRKSTSNAR